MPIRSCLFSLKFEESTRTSRIFSRRCAGMPAIVSRQKRGGSDFLPTKKPLYLPTKTLQIAFIFKNILPGNSLMSQSFSRV